MEHESGCNAEKRKFIQLAHVRLMKSIALKAAGVRQAGSGYVIEVIPSRHLTYNSYLRLRSMA